MNVITYKLEDRYALNTFMVRNLNGKKLEMLLAQHISDTVHIAYHAMIYIVMPLHLSTYF